jgi:hypothetical protein
MFRKNIPISSSGSIDKPSENWRWIQHVPPKSTPTFNRLRGVTCVPAAKQDSSSQHEEELCSTEMRRWAASYRRKVAREVHAWTRRSNSRATAQINLEQFSRVALARNCLHNVPARRPTSSARFYEWSINNVLLYHSWNINTSFFRSFKSCECYL